MSGKQYQSSKAMKSPPIWQKFRGITKTRENGAKEKGSVGTCFSGQDIGGDGSQAYLVHRRRQKRGLPALRGCSSHFLIGVA